MLQRGLGQACLAVSFLIFICCLSRNQVEGIEGCEAIAGCSTCSSVNPPMCTRCKFANFTVDVDGTCKPCGSDCKACNTNGPGNCDACNSGFSLNSPDPPNLCQKCQTQDCGICTADLATCTHCASGFYPSSSACLPCDEFCTFCDDNPPTCKAGYCKSGYDLNSALKCVAKPQAPCAPGCTSCDNAGGNKCDTCKSGFVVSSCSGRCLECDANCDTCDPSNFNCINCKPGYNLDSSGSCVLPGSSGSSVSSGSSGGQYGQSENSVQYYTETYTMVYEYTEILQQ